MLEWIVGIVSDKGLATTLETITAFKRTLQQILQFEFQHIAAHVVSDKDLHMCSSAFENI